MRPARFLPVRPRLYRHGHGLIPSLKLFGLTAPCLRPPTGTIASYGLSKRVEAVKNCRNVSKRDMKNNTATPKMKIDPETYRVSPSLPLCAPVGGRVETDPARARPPARSQVEADGVHCTVPPATKVALTRGYMLF